MYYQVGIEYSGEDMQATPWVEANAKGGLPAEVAEEKLIKLYDARIDWLQRERNRFVAEMIKCLDKLGTKTKPALSVAAEQLERDDMNSRKDLPPGHIMDASEPELAIGAAYRRIMSRYFSARWCGFVQHAPHRQLWIYHTVPFGGVAFVSHH